MAITTANKRILNSPIPSATTGETAPQLNEWWPVEYIEPFKDKGDPLADRVMDILYAEGRADAAISGNPADRPRRTLQFLQLVINRLTIPDPEKEHPFVEEDPNYTFTPEVKAAMQDFLRQGSKLPDWADMDMVRQAQKLFADNPIVAYTLLACLSLPVLYTCGRGGIQVLILTEQLDRKVRRRIIETGMLTLGVMVQDSFLKLPDKSNLTNPIPMGIEGILRVRLLHAASRTVIHEFWKDGVKDRAAEAGKAADVPSKVRNYQGKAADQIWKEEWGMPIGQQYLAGTLMTFSYIILYGLKELGVILDEKDLKAYMHFWNVFGYVLGIDEELLLKLDFPGTGKPQYVNNKPVHAATGHEMYEVGKALYTQVMKLNRSSDEDSIRDGRILTKAVLDYASNVIKENTPGKVPTYLTRLPKMLMWKLLSKDDRHLLGVNITPTDAILIPFALLLFKIRGIFSKVTGTPSNAIANLIFRLMQADTTKVYDQLQQETGVRYPGVPMEFQEKWGLVKKS